MTPTANELRIRNLVVDRFKTLMAELEPDTVLSIVGSTATNLCFALSDIDLVGRSSTTWGASLYTLESKIRRARFADDITVISRAEVPVIKLIDAKTGLEINLVYASGGIGSTRLVQEWKARFDAVDLGAGKGLFTIVVFFAKQFLKMRRLAETYTGGINSYLLVLMVVAWWELEYRPKVSVPNVLPASQAVQDAMLVQAVVSFLKYYGSGLDYARSCIRISPSPEIVRKGFYQIRPWHLSLVDPNTGSDIGKKAYAIKHVTASFLAAARELEDARYVWGGSREMLDNVLGGNYRKFVAERAAVLRDAGI